MSGPTYEPADWTPKPGDIARITVLNTTVTAYLSGRYRWRRLGNDNESWHESEVQRGARLEVVDPATTVTLRPDNPDDVKRLHDALKSDFYYGTPDIMAAALRSLLPPSAPPEPNGLGADVVDALGEWVRVDYSNRPWRSVADGSTQSWDDMRGQYVVAHGHRCTCSGPGCPGGEQDA